MAEQEDRPGATTETAGNELSAHLAFQQQLAELLDQADITEEQLQQFLIAASCPCCGAGGLSISLKLKSSSTPGF